MRPSALASDGPNRISHPLLSDAHGQGASLCSNDRTPQRPGPSRSSLVDSCVAPASDPALAADGDRFGRQARGGPTAARVGSAWGKHQRGRGALAQSGARRGGTACGGRRVPGDDRPRPACEKCRPGFACTRSPRPSTATARRPAARSDRQVARQRASRLRRRAGPDRVQASTPGPRRRADRRKVRIPDMTDAKRLTAGHPSPAGVENRLPGPTMTMMLDFCLTCSASRRRPGPTGRARYGRFAGVSTMEPAGLEPATSCLQSRRSPN